MTEPLKMTAANHKIAFATFVMMNSLTCAQALEFPKFFGGAGTPAAAKCYARMPCCLYR
jgi:hypothetical protein